MLVGLMARMINLVKLSEQIILGFFFYGWRNSLYGELVGYSPVYFKGLETGTRLFVQEMGW